MINRLISNRVINLITHPLLLAFLATVLTTVLTPREFDKYQLELLKSGLEGGVYRNSVYIDLDSDGTKEKIHMRNLDTNANLVAFSQQNRILGTWILPGYWYRVPGYYLGNTDADETIELIAISIDSRDSVWVTQLDLDEDNRSKTNRFVCTLTRQNNSLDHTIRTAGFYDITGDNHPEFIFSISSGFSLHPRACFAWDLTNDTILRTPLAGINYHNLMAVYSSKYGNRIFPSVVATQNYKQAIPYSDTASYAFVLTKDLKYQFVPVYAGGSQSLTTTVPIQASLTWIFNRVSISAGFQQTGQMPMVEEFTLITRDWLQ